MATSTTRVNKQIKMGVLLQMAAYFPHLLPEWPKFGVKKPPNGSYRGAARPCTVCRLG